LTLRRSIVLCVLLGALIFGWLRWRDLSSLRQLKETPGPTIDKKPATFANRAFDPGNPPEDMPVLAPGENGVCDSNFLSSANVGGEAQQTDATHAMVTITQIKVTLQLNVIIWLPPESTQHVIEHEAGHRQISEYYYQTADQLAGRIAAAYMGKRIAITGTDLHAELGKLLEQTGNDITDEYNRELNPEPTQLRYDAITDHGRNEVAADAAFAQVLKDATLASSPTATNPQN
jgi:hypothetical protein